MTRAFAFSNANPRQAELLSYLTGLAPVGEPFEFRCNQAAADLGFGAVRSIYHRLQSLIDLELVARIGKRQSLVVLIRLEEL